MMVDISEKNLETVIEALLLAGGHDSDTFMLYGQSQYNRTRFNDSLHDLKRL